MLHTYKHTTKAKETPSPHEVRLALLHNNPVFYCLRGKLPDCLCFLRYCTMCVLQLFDIQPVSP